MTITKTQMDRWAADVDYWRKKYDQLRARLTALEGQEPVAVIGTKAYDIYHQSNDVQWLEPAGSKTVMWFKEVPVGTKLFLAAGAAPTTGNIVVDSYNHIVAMKEAAKAAPKVSNELTQLGLQELHAFQEATGFDTAAEFGANYSNYKLLLEAVTFIAYVNAMDYEYQEVAKIALRKICQN